MNGDWFWGHQINRTYTTRDVSDGIVKYMKSKAGPVSKDLTSVADAEKFLRRDESAVVGKHRPRYTVVTIFTTEA